MFAGLISISGKKNTKNMEKGSGGFKTKQTRLDYFNKRRRECKKFIQDYKEGKSCIKCGWKAYPDILEFHHRDPKEKLYNLSFGGIANISRARLEIEIAKCDLLCPNCHRVLHHLERVDTAG